MRRRALALGLLATPFLARGAAADAGTLRLCQQYGLPFLPMMVMERQRLLEAEAGRRGLPSLKVEWTSVAGAIQQLDGLLAGQFDVITPGVPTLATIWDRTVGTARETRALCAMQSMPYVLITRNPAVRTIQDFTEKDRIALPAVKLTGHALALEMEAAKVWGEAQYERLDPLTLTLSHPDAFAALQSPQTGITAHFASSPFHYYELAIPGMHQVLKSYDVVGRRHTNGTVIVTTRFHDANPGLCAVMVAAFEAANAFIKKEPRQAAEIYLAATGEKRNTASELENWVADPDVDYTTTPVATMPFIDFMHKVGRLRHRPDDWKGVFFPEAHGLAGS